MRGGHAGGRDGLEGGVPEHDSPPQEGTWHVGEHIRSGFSVLVCRVLNMDHLNLFPGPPEGHQPRPTPRPW